MAYSRSYTIQLAYRIMPASDKLSLRTELRSKPMLHRCACAVKQRLRHFGHGTGQPRVAMHLIYKRKASREDTDPEMTLVITRNVVWKACEIVCENIRC